MPRIRLLVLGPLPPPAGGVETVTCAVLGSDAFTGMDVQHCDTTKKRSKDTQGKFDVGNLMWAVVHFARLTGAMIRFRPHAVYMPLTATWSGFWRDAVLAWIAKRGGARIVGHVHGSWLDRILAPRGVTGRLVRFCLAQFDALLMLGEYWRQMISDYGYRGKIFVVPSTFERSVLEASHHFHRNYDVAESRGLFVGQLGRNKGVLDLLHALARIKAEGKTPRFTLVGGPQFAGDWDEILRLREALGLTDLVEMTGILLGDALYERYRRADYFVLPSYFEGLPVVLFEAGCFGLPVITTPVGSVPELIQHDVNGLLISPGDVGALHAAIERLRNDAQVRERLGAAMKEHAARYQPDVICRKIATVIRALTTPAHAENPQAVSSPEAEYPGTTPAKIVEGLTDADKRRAL